MDFEDHVRPRSTRKRMRHRGTVVSKKKLVPEGLNVIQHGVTWGTIPLALPPNLL
jgi:hypothetical protein